MTNPSAPDVPAVAVPAVAVPARAVPARAESAQAVPPGSTPAARGGRLRPVLWLVLVVSAAANMVTTSAGMNALVGIGFGLLTLACVIGLVVDHYAHRDA